MCLSIQKKDFKKKRAYRDIPIFKVVWQTPVSRRKVWSHLKGFTYDLNKTYHTRLGVRNSLVEVSVHEGFHSFSTEQCTFVSISDSTSCSQGFYEIFAGHPDPDTPDCCIKASIYYGCRVNDLAIVKGYIPKGATYVTDGKGLMASTQIVLTEFRDISDENINEWLHTKD